MSASHLVTLGQPGERASMSIQSSAVTDRIGSGNRVAARLAAAVLVGLLIGGMFPISTVLAVDTTPPSLAPLTLTPSTVASGAPTTVITATATDDGGIASAQAAVRRVNSGTVSRSGTQLTLDGQPFRFTGFNLYNANNVRNTGCTGTNLGSGTALSATLDQWGPGKQVMRAWFFQNLAQPTIGAGTTYDWSAFDHTLAVADAHGLKVIATLTNQWGECGDGLDVLPGSFKTKQWYVDGYKTAPGPGLYQTYLSYVRDVVTRYRGDSRIAFWQLVNEAEVRTDINEACPPHGSPSNPANAEGNLRATILKDFAADVSGLIKSLDPDHLVSLGTLGGGQCGAVGDQYKTVHDVPTIDLCEYHDYLNPTVSLPAEPFNGLVRRISQCGELNKPIFVGEAGIIPTGNGGYAGRATLLTAKRVDQMAAGVVGFVAWNWVTTGSSLATYAIGAGDPALDALNLGSTAMSATDGTLGGTSEGLTATVTAPSVPGTYEVCVWATDGAGNVTAGTACSTLTVDGSPPLVTGIGVAPSPANFGAALSVTATATDPAAVAWTQLSVDGAPWTQMGASDGAFGGISEAVNRTYGASAVEVVARATHACALTANRTVRCWGENAGGQLGDGTKIDRSFSVPVAGLSNVLAIAVGYRHSCALLGDRTVSCWGDNSTGQLGDGTTIEHLAPSPVVGLAGIRAITASYWDTCALDGGGTVWCWGRNDAGGLGDGTTEQRSAPVAVLGIAGATSISAGPFYTCAVLTDRTGRCWGSNYHGELGDGTTTDRLSPVAVDGLADVVKISAGETHTCALLGGGTVRCWGENVNGQLGDGTTTDRLYPVVTVGLSGAIDVATGAKHTCSILADTTVRCWGRNGKGELGDGTNTIRLIAVASGALSGVRSITAGDQSTCALLASGRIDCWGFNYFGQLGDGATALDRYTPVHVAGFEALSAGIHSVCIRAADGVGNISGGTSCMTVTVRPLGYTPPGADVIVEPVAPDGTAPATVTFGTVTVAGASALTTSTAEPALPIGYQIGTPPTFYDITTTAAYSGLITVCISSAGVTPTPTNLLHFEGGVWIDITTNVDTVNQVVCGTTTSLSPFALATRTPVLTVPSGVTAIATGPSGAVVIYVATAMNSIGAPVPSACASASGTVFPIGTTTVNCVAADVSGTPFSASFTVTVGYRFVGFSQPLNDPISALNPMSVFKGGSTISVKFALTYANGAPILDSAASAIATACGATISLTRTAGAAPPVDEAVTSTQPSAGSCFRYDATSDHFIYNLATKGLAAAALYELKASLLGAAIVSPILTLQPTHSLTIGVR